MGNDTASHRFYVYILARPNGMPFYIGKGQGKRIYGHEDEARKGHNCYKCNVIRKIWRNGGGVQRYIVFTTDDEQEALQQEKDLIALHGRENLCNLTDGGDGVSGLPLELHPSHKYPEIRQGERNPAAKLTAAQATEIRQRWATDTTRVVDLAAEYGVSARTIVSVVRQEHWGVDGTPRTRSTAQRAELRRGERSACALFTWEQVRDMRRRYAEGGVSGSEMSREYGVAESCILDILHNTTWYDAAYTPPTELQAVFDHCIARGERNGNARLTQEAVRAIRTRFDSTRATIEQIAAEYGVYGSVIAKVVTNTSWHDPSYVPPSRRDKHHALTPEQKAEIAARYAAGGISYQQLATEYDCSIGTAYAAVNPGRRNRL